VQHHHDEKPRSRAYELQATALEIPFEGHAFVPHTATPGGGVDHGHGHPLTTARQPMRSAVDIETWSMVFILVPPPMSTGTA
jgi:hypothetical protein